MIAALLLTLALQARAQDPPVNEREYRLLFGDPVELEPLAVAGVSLNKAFTDAYQVGIGPHVPYKAHKVLQVGWQVWFTFNMAMWPHELGHWARAEQVGGTFVIEGYGFPFPRARMDLPPSVTPEQGVLTSVAGFEVNHLMRRQEVSGFYDEGYGHSDVLVHSFIQEIYFPLYTWAVAVAAPRKPETWTETRGDPVEWVLGTYGVQTGRPPVRANGTVDPELVARYREAVFANLGTILVDPMFYQGAHAFAVNTDDDWGRMEPWMLGSDRFGWMFSTAYLPTPLGYEIWWNHHLRLGGLPATVSLKAGRPTRNLGLRVDLPRLVAVGPVDLGLEADGWSQERYGDGAAGYADLRVRLPRGLFLELKGGGKSEGWLVGRRIEASPMVLGGLGWRFQPPVGNIQPPT